MGSFAADRRFKIDSVCVVGAGPSGLAAAKYLRDEGAFSRITVFEQRATVGGVWNYIACNDSTPPDLSIPQTNPHAGLDVPLWSDGKRDRRPDENGADAVSFMSPLYDRLETNIPRGLMGFSDLDWNQELQLFPKHADVLDYIDQYAEDVRKLVQFRTQVVEISGTMDDRWRVKTQSIDRDLAQNVTEHAFDAVVVASGHFDVPHIPSVPGIEDWCRAHPGRVSHSKFYRLPENYAGKKVIIVGNSASGSDIGSQIISVCKPPLIQSQKSESLFISDSTSPRIEKPPIVEYIVENRSVKFQDGSVESEVDAVLYCTGYFYSFPFLDTLEPAVITTGERTRNLYQHIFYHPRPTLSFLVLNQKVIPFPVAEVQSAVIARVLSGRLSLPGEAEMERWEQENIAHYGDGKNFHVLKFPEDADYINMLHGWSMQADGETPDRTRKTPPYWGERERWMRSQFPKIKKTFQDLGDGRHSVRTLEELGYDFEKWKEAQNVSNAH